VGNPPEQSPFRDIVRSQTVSASVGYLTGSRGRAGVGPSDGFVFGARYELRLAGPTDLTVSLAWAGTDRFVVDPTKPVDERTTGPVGQSLVLLDAGFLFMLTGEKTWRGLAPYLAVSLGLAFGQSTPQDTSGYEFGTRFTLQPAAGVRYYLGRSLYLRLEARDVLWQLRYPLSYFEQDVGIPPVLQLGTGETQWTHHLLLSTAVGFAFRL
jgi:hypothetical protein